MKIVYLLGKSASGKDAFFQRLQNNKELHFATVTLYTTRPMRSGEEEGKEYFFIDERQAEELRQAHKVIEERTYLTVHGPWTYLTVDDGQFSRDRIYLMIGTLESYRKLRDFFGREAMVPVYIEVDTGLRLERALARERKQAEPKYAEMCRRFLADEEDFSEEHIREAGISRRFENNGDIEDCFDEIYAYVKEQVTGSDMCLQRNHAAE